MYVIISDTRYKFVRIGPGRDVRATGSPLRPQTHAELNRMRRIVHRDGHRKSQPSLPRFISLDARDNSRAIMSEGGEGNSCMYLVARCELLAIIRLSDRRTNPRLDSTREMLSSETQAFSFRNDASININCINRNAKALVQCSPHLLQARSLSYIIYIYVIFQARMDEKDIVNAGFRRSRARSLREAVKQPRFRADGHRSRINRRRLKAQVIYHSHRQRTQPWPSDNARSPQDTNRTFGELR